MDLCISFLYKLCHGDNQYSLRIPDDNLYTDHPGNRVNIRKNLSNTLHLNHNSSILVLVWELKAMTKLNITNFKIIAIHKSKCLTCLFNFQLASCECVSGKTFRAITNWNVIEYRALGIYSTRSRTRIFALVRKTSLIARTVWVYRTFWATIWRYSNEWWFASARCLIFHDFTFWIRSTWWGQARIYRCFSLSWKL